MDMSFKEKSAWLSLIALFWVFGDYFFRLNGFADLPPEDAKRAALFLLGKSVVYITIIEIVFSAALAFANQREASLGADERDKTISLKATRNGHLVLIVGVMIVLGRSFFLEYRPDYAEAASLASIPMLTSHMLMFAFIFSEVVRIVSQLVYYRRGH